MDSGMRLQLFVMFPSIQYLEKLFPLHVKYLTIKSDHITVNRTTFQLKICNKYNNFHGGYKFDFDQYGRLDRGEIEQDPDESIIDVRDGFLSKKGIPECEMETARLVHNLTLQKSQRYSTRIWESHGTILKKLSYYVPENNFIRLKIGKRVEVLEYQRKIHEAMKYLLGRLFGGRSLEANQFSIGCDTVLRVPSTLKFRIENLYTPSFKIANTLDVVNQIVDNTSLPLSSLKYSFENHIYHHPHSLVRTVKMLKLEVEMVPDYISGIVSNLQMVDEKRAHIVFLGDCTSSNFLKILAHWILEFHRDIGTYHTYQLSEAVVDEVMIFVRTNYGVMIEAGLPQTTDQITLNINDTSSLVISKFQQKEKWIFGLKMEH